MTKRRRTRAGKSWARTREDRSAQAGRGRGRKGTVPRQGRRVETRATMYIANFLCILMGASRRRPHQLATAERR
jgi:hypothetical protein